MDADTTLPGLPPADPDRAWRESLPLELQPVAARCGRELFATVMNIKAINYFNDLIAKRVRGNHELELAIRSLADHTNKLLEAYIITKKWTGLQLSEVAGDIDRAAALANGGGQIILPGRLH